MIATGVIIAGLVISAICSFLFGAILRTIMYFGSSNHNFNIYDEQSKFSVVAAGIFFAFFFTAFIFKPHR